MMKIYKKWGPLLVLLMLTASLTFAQSLRVSGKVTDETGAPIPGANILEKGTTNGTITDGNGEFAINVATGTSTLVFTFIGYKTQEVSVDARSTIDVNLVADATALSEVVVTGYTTERKADLVSAISQVSAAN